MLQVSDIRRKLFSNRGQTSDANGRSFSVGDTVNITSGRYAGKSGTVKAIQWQKVFLQSREIKDHEGFVCAAARQCSVGGAGNGADAGFGRNPSATPGPAGYAPMSPSMALKSPAPHRAMQQQGDVLASPRHQPGAGPQGWGGGGGGRGGGRGGGGGHGGRGGHGRVGQSVKVSSGPYTGYKGRVKQETATHVQLELDAINRIVTVKKTDVRFPGEGGPGRGGYGGFQPGRGYQPSGFQPGRGYQPGGYPNQTPLHPSATPRHPSQVRVTWAKIQGLKGNRVYALCFPCAMPVCQEPCLSPLACTPAFLPVQPPRATVLCSLTEWEHFCQGLIPCTGFVYKGYKSRCPAYLLNTGLKCLTG